MIRDLGVYHPIWPNFFIVGAQKAGTTSLYEYLKHHPQVYMSPRKEPYYFAKDRIRVDSDLVVTRETDYLQLFIAAKGFKAVGEASPCYLWHSEVASRIYEVIPEARIIILLRDPVERAYSHYLMDILDGMPVKTFYDVIVEQYQQGEKVFGTGYLYVELGLYYEQVKRYLDKFGPSRVIVLMFEDLMQRPIETIARVAKFLDLDQWPVRNDPSIRAVYLPYRAPRNRLIQWIMRFRTERILWRRFVPLGIRRFVRNTLLTKSDSKPPMDPHAAAFLQSLYEPDLQLLEALLGQPLPALRRTWK